MSPVNKMRWGWFVAGMLVLPSMFAVLLIEAHSGGAIHKWYLSTVAVRPGAAAAEADELLRRAAAMPRFLDAVRLTGPAELGGAGMSQADLSGDYYEVADVVIDLPGGERRIVAVPRNGNYPVLWCTITPAGELQITQGN